MKLTEKVTYTYDHFYKYQEITDILQKYASDYPEIARLTSAGTSPQGRNLWVLEVTNTKTGAYEDKPGYYVEGNIHAGEVTGCMTCMYFLDVIFSNLDSKEVQSILDKYTIYVLPRVSPDGSEHYLTTPDYVRSVPRMYPYTEEMPGLQPKDLDGDGVVRKMRVKSPFGIWKVSDKDPRVMTKRRPDDIEGEFYNVYEEGIINDFDGLNIVSAPARFGHDFNRNYPVGWKPEPEQRGAGEYPLCHPETKANTDFLLAHPNIGSVLDMHTAGGQNLYTPGFKPRKEAERYDVNLYKILGKMAKEENGYPVINVYDEYMPVGSPACFGGFDDFCHFILGVPAFTIECWDIEPRVGIEVQFPPKPETTDEEQEEEALKYVQWIDKELDGEGCKPWTKYNHPQLGEVEIGGVDYKYVCQNPPIKFLVQELEKHTRFMLRQVKTLPMVKFTDIKIENLAGDVYRVEAIISNTGFLSTYVLKEALKFKTLKELTVTMEGAEVIEGKAKQGIGHLEGFSGIGGYNSGLGASTMQFAPCQKKLTWIIKAQPGAKLTFACEGGRMGRTTAEATI